MSPSTEKELKHLEEGIENPVQEPYKGNEHTFARLTLQKWNQYGSYIVRGIQFTAVLTFFCLTIWLFVPSSRTAKLKYTVQEPYDWTDYARSHLELFENAAPGSTKGLADIIPEKWPLGKTEYYVHSFGFCRKTENKSDVCRHASNSAIRSQIIQDIGLVFAESLVGGTIKLQHVATSWKNAFDDAYQLAFNSLSTSTFHNFTTVNTTNTAMEIIEDYGRESPNFLFAPILFSVYLMFFILAALGLLLVNHGVSMIMSGVLAILWMIPLVIEAVCHPNRRAGFLEETKTVGGVTVHLLMIALMTVTTTIGLLQMYKDKKFGEF